MFSVLCFRFYIFDMFSALCFRFEIVDLFSVLESFSV